MVQQTLNRAIGTAPEIDPKDALKQLVCIYADQLSWSARYAGACRSQQKPLNWFNYEEADAGLNDCLLRAFSIAIDDIQLLNIDFLSLMRQIAQIGIEKARHARPPIDYWASAIKRVGVRVNDDDETYFIVPGEPVPYDIKLIRVVFNLDPYYLPFSNLLDMLRKYSHQLELKLKDVVFWYEKQPVLSIVRFSEMVRISDLNVDALCRDILKWCENTNAQIDINPEYLRLNDMNTNEFLNKLRNVFVTRTRLASILGRTPRTLINWDVRQCVPTGERWSSPLVIGRNEVRYNVYENWNAIVSLFPADRDKDRDRQLADEILAIKD